MAAALDDLERQSDERWRIDVDREALSSDLALRTLLVEELPTTPQSRTFQILRTSYAMLAMTDPALAGQPFIDGPHRHEHAVKRLIEHAIEANHLDSTIEATATATVLVSLVHGLGASILVEQRTSAEGTTVRMTYLSNVFDRGERPGRG